MTELFQFLAVIMAAASGGGAEAAASGAFNPNFALAIAGAGAAIGVGLIGSKAAEAVGRNPTAFGNILTISIIGMALAEAIAIYALVVVFTN